jgi:hypothetical protein
MEGRGLRPIRLAERNGGNGPAKKPAKDSDEGIRKGTSQGIEAWRVTAVDEVVPRRREQSLGADAGKLHAPALELAGCRGAAQPCDGHSFAERHLLRPAAAKWKQVYDLVIDGMSLADAMAKSPETFPRVYVAMVEAGETGGFLDVVLGQIADFQAREKEMRSKVMTALLYR